MTTSALGGRSTMTRVSLRNLAAHKVRLVLTVLSVVLGTSFVAGSIIFTGTISSAFNAIFDKVALGVDARVSPSDSRSAGVPNAVFDELQTRSGQLGIAKLVPRYSAPITIAAKDGTAIQTGGAPSIGTGYVVGAQALSSTEGVLEPGGRAPQGTGEIALNASAARQGDLTVGSTTTLVVSRGSATPMQVKVVGLLDLPQDTGRYLNVQMEQSVARTVFSDGDRSAYVEAAAVPGVSATQLTERIGRAVGDGYTVQTGAQVRQEEKDRVNQFLTVFNYILLGFALIGLIVGTFIIYNTFAMIVAQRVRELALLRAIGASRSQITRSVLLEAFVVGVIGGAAGLGIGVGLAALLKAITSSQSGLPSAALNVTPTAVIACMAVGIVVTMVSAYAPARRAAQVAPVEAMRESATDGASSLRRRTLIGALLAVISVVLLGVGTSGQGNTWAVIVAAGALVGIFAVVFAAPALSRPAVGALGRVIGRPFGKIGVLARTNAVRNPRRTAATAFALTLGLMLVAVVGTFGSSLKTSIDDTVSKNLSADLVLATSDQGSTLPTSVVQAATNSPEVADAVSFRIVAAKVKGDAVSGVSPSGDLAAVTPYEMVDGSSKTVPPDGMIVSQKTSTAKGWKRGDVIRFDGYAGTSTDVRVTGVFADNQVLDPWLMGQNAYDTLVPPGFRADRIILVKAKPGASVTALRDRLTAATKGYLTVQVQDRKEFVGQASSQIDQMLATLYAMLGLALVIAVLGIINTLALSVIERTREIGMLRAIGMARAQIRRTIYVESVLIAIFGAVLGVILGSVFGVAVVRTFRDLGITRPVLPWSLIGITLAAAALVGVLAALWPAVRAARTNPLDAISEA